MRNILDHSFWIFGTGLVASGLYLFWSSRQNNKNAAPPETTALSSNAHDTVLGNKIKILDGDTLLSEPHRQALIHQIEERMAFTSDGSEQDIKPLLRGYAQFVQLLPASETHHHAHPGGLLDHTLEVASIALRVASAMELPLNTSTEDRKKFTPVWKYGVLVAAILHDIGKTLTNMEIILYESPLSRDGIRWHPDAGDMLNVSQYHWYSVSFLDENPEYNIHARLGWSLFNLIVPSKARAWLATTDQRLIVSLREFLTGAAVEPFSKILKSADSESTENNLKHGSRVRFASAKRQPIRELLMDNLREMLVNQTYTVGKDSGGELFRFGDKVFFMGKVFADKLRAHINAKGNFSVPQDNERIFGALFECGACLPNPWDVNKYNWTVNVSMKSGSHTFNGICFDANVLFTGDMFWPNEYLGKIEAVEFNQKSQNTKSEEQSVDATNIATSKVENKETELDVTPPTQIQLAQPQIKPDSTSTSTEVLNRETSSVNADNDDSEIDDESMVEIVMSRIKNQSDDKVTEHAATDVAETKHIEPTNLLIEETSEPTHQSQIIENSENAIPKVDTEPVQLATIGQSSFERLHKSPSLNLSVTELLSQVPNVSMPKAPGNASSKNTIASNNASTSKTKSDNSNKSNPIENQSSQSESALNLNQLRPVDISTEIDAESLRLRRDMNQILDGVNPDVEIDAKRQLCINFLLWIQRSILNESLLVNRPDAAVHIIDDGVLLLTPKIFHLFTGDETPTDEKGSPSKLAQQAFESLKLHERSKVSGQFYAKVIPIGGSKAVRMIRVYWISSKKARTLFSNLPPINNRIELQRDGHIPKL